MRAAPISHILEIQFTGQLLPRASYIHQVLAPEQAAPAVLPWQCQSFQPCCSYFHNHHPLFGLCLGPFCIRDTRGRADISRVSRQKLRAMWSPPFPQCGSKSCHDIVRGQSGMAPTGTVLPWHLGVLSCSLGCQANVLTSQRSTPTPTFTSFRKQAELLGLLLGSPGGSISQQIYFRTTWVTLESYLMPSQQPSHSPPKIPNMKTSIFPKCGFWHLWVS